MTKYIFVDTNVFEHFPPLSNIDWVNLARCHRVVLLIAPITISELNKHKDTSSRPKHRARASAALLQLAKYAKTTPPAYIRDEVEIRFATNEPLIDFTQHQLSPDVPDDRLLASAIEFAAKNKLSASDVLLTTADLGLELKAGTKPEITPLAIPPELRLPEEVDPETKRIRELEEELRSLKSTFPRLTLTPLESASFAEISVPESILLDEEALQARIGDERKRLPRREILVPDNAIQTAIVSLVMTEPVESYNAALDKYFTSYEKWIREMAVAYEWHRLTPKLKLQVENTGGAPATDVEVDIHFPDGFEVLQKEQLPKSPKKPSPPLTPEERLSAALVPNLDFGLSNYRIPEVTVPRASEILGIKKTNSHLLKAWIREVKHHRTAPIPSIYLHFHSEGSVKSFRITYEILAANYPEKYSGVLDVVVK